EQKSQEMLKNEAIGQGFFYTMNWKEADDYLLKVIDHPDFNEYFPPYLKVITLEALGLIRLGEGNFSEALDFANRALAFDYDLDKPSSNGWPGFGIFKAREGDQKDQLVGSTGMPNRVLGDIYREMGELEKARENYRLSLEKCERLNISEGAQFWLEALNEKLKK
ncbi:MAG: tetratricopeptide repeat protein, partial [Patescibacteria group bacterium]